jgi:hypothetical protein
VSGLSLAVFETLTLALALALAHVCCAHHVCSSIPQGRKVPCDGTLYSLQWYVALHSPPRFTSRALAQEAAVQRHGGFQEASEDGVLQPGAYTRPLLSST